MIRALALLILLTLPAPAQIRDSALPRVVGGIQATDVVRIVTFVGTTNEATKSALASEFGAVLSSNIAYVTITNRDPRTMEWEVWNNGVSSYNAKPRDGGPLLHSNSLSGLLQFLNDSSPHQALSIKFGTLFRGAQVESYWLSNTVYITKSLVMAGAGNPVTQLLATNFTGAMFRFGSNGVVIPGIVEVRNIRFQVYNSHATGLLFDNCAEPVIKDCEFNNFGKAGIEINNEENLYNFWSGARSCWFVIPSSNNSAGILFRGYAGESEFTIINCYFDTQGGDCVRSDYGFNGIRASASRFAYSGGATNVAIRIHGGGNHSFIGNYFMGWPDGRRPIFFTDNILPAPLNTIILGNQLVYNMSYATTTNLVHVGADNVGVVSYANLSDSRLTDVPVPIGGVSAMPLSTGIPTNAFVWMQSALPATNDYRVPVENLTPRINDWTVWSQQGTNYVARNAEGFWIIQSNSFSGLMQWILDNAPGPAANSAISIRLGTLGHYRNPLSYFWVSNTIIVTRHFNLRGAGDPISVVIATNLASPMFQFGTVGVPAPGRTELSGIAFYSHSRESNVSALYFYRAPEPVISQCTFSGFGDCGIRMQTPEGQYWSSINDCWFIVPTNLLSCGISFEPLTDVTELLVNRCLFGTSGGDCIRENYARGMRVENCRFRYDAGETNVAIRSLYSFRTRIAGNTFDYWPETRRPIFFQDGDPGFEDFFNVQAVNNNAGLSATTNLVFVSQYSLGAHLSENIVAGNQVNSNFRVGVGGAITKSILTNSALIDFTSISGGAFQTSSIALAGVTTNDISTVSAVPQVFTVANAGGVFLRTLASNNIVYIQAINAGTTACDLAPGIFTVRVEQH